MSTIIQILPGGYPNTDSATFIEGLGMNNGSRNHNNAIRSNDQPGNRALASFTGEVTSVGAVLLKQYLLRDFYHPKEIIIVFRDLKYPYAHIDMDKPINLSKEDK